MVPFPSVQASDGAFYSALGLVGLVALIAWPRPWTGKPSTASSSGPAGPAAGGLRGRGWYSLLAAVAALAGTLQIRSVDLFWHLAAGRWILSHGAVPRHDPFRFSSLQVPWVDHEWLFQLVVAFVEGLFGLEMLVVARAIFLVGLVLFLAWSLGRTGAPLSAVAVLAVATVVVVRGRLFLRPEMVTMAGLALVLALLQEHRRRGGGVGGILGLSVVVALWANGHPGVVMVPGIAAAFLVGSRFPGGHGTPARGPEPRALKEIVGIPLVIAVAILANPYGLEVFLASQKIFAAFRDLDAVNPDWANAWNAPRPFFYAVIGALAVFTLVARRRGARLDPATGFVLLLLLPLGLAGVRHQPLVAITASFFAAETAAALPRRQGAQRWSAALGTGMAVATCVAVAVWCVASPVTGPFRARGAAPQFGFGLQPFLQPAAAVDRIEEMPDLGNLYNDVAFGGFLLWRLFPPRQVFIDTRNEVDPGILREVEEARRDSRRWDALLRRHTIDGALVRYDERQIPVYPPPGVGGLDRVPEHHTSTALLFPDALFALVYWDDRALLFVRRTPERDAHLDGIAYRAAQPEDWRAMLSQAAVDPVFRTAVCAELQRRIKESPPSTRAVRLLEAVESLPASGEPLSPTSSP